MIRRRLAGARVLCTGYSVLRTRCSIPTATHAAEFAASSSTSAGLSSAAVRGFRNWSAIGNAFTASAIGPRGVEPLLLSQIITAHWPLPRTAHPKNENLEFGPFKNNPINPATRCFELRLMNLSFPAG